MRPGRDGAKGEVITMSGEEFRRKLVTIDAASNWVGLSTWTVRRRIASGHLKGYRIAGTRGIRVDLRDVEAMLHEIPAGGGGDVPQAS